MTPRFIAYSLAGLIGIFAVTTLVLGRPPVQQPAPALARSTVPADPVEPAVAARRRIVIEPLPVPLVKVRLSNVNTQETATFQIWLRVYSSSTTDSSPYFFFRSLEAALSGSAAVK